MFSIAGGSTVGFGGAGKRNTAVEWNGVISAAIIHSGATFGLLLDRQVSAIRTVGRKDL